jgi:hypothetical protein
MKRNKKEKRRQEKMKRNCQVERTAPPRWRSGDQQTEVPAQWWVTLWR